MKQLLFSFFLLIGATFAMSQAKQPPAIGRIYGKLVDSTGKPVADASVILLQKKMDTASKKLKEVLVKGMSTQRNGDFNFEGLPIMSQYTVQFSAAGFQPREEAVSLMPNMKANNGMAGGPKPGQMAGMSAMTGGFEKDLGKMELKTDVQQLQAVVVTSNNARLRMDIDKKVFNVDQNIVTAGGTAVDVMKNVPSVNVDINGNVTLRNASPQIYIDGRPTTLSLDQIPADAIESVEVITNPSAKYDASGGNAGILNIVLKKNKKTGYNGNIMAGVDKRGGINGGGSFNLRQDKFNFSINGFANRGKNRGSGTTGIQDLLSSPIMLVDQSSQSKMNGGFIFGKIGVDYFISNRTTLSVGAIKVHGNFNSTSMLFTDSAYKNGSYISYSERNNPNKRGFDATGLQGGFKYLFPTKGEELTGDINYFSGKNNGNSLYQTRVLEQPGGISKGDIEQKMTTSGSSSFLTIQSDYVKPLGKSGKLETGARMQLRSLEDLRSNYYFDAASNSFVMVPSSGSNYRNHDNVYAAYLSITSKIKDFGYQLGLRAESSDYEGELIGTKENFNNKYPVSLFPSIFLSQKLKKEQELQLSYTRRINRPFFMQLIPFIDSTNQLNWARGNADLRPEFTHSIEASYTKNFQGNNTLMASVYYKYTTDLITRYLDTIGIENGVKRPVSTFMNANSSRTIGAEITSQNTFTKWWDMNTNVNLYNARINIENIDGASPDARWSWFAKMNNNFKLPKNFKIQLSGTYQSKTNLPVDQGGGREGGPMSGPAQSSAQGYIKANYGIDLALQKSFLKNNAASITFSVNDVFATRKYDQFTISQYYIQNSTQLNDVPMFRLNFSFRFGQMDMSLLKRKNMKGESEGSQNVMEVM